MEAEPQTGGQATSIPLDESKYGSSWLNDGVQGGSLDCIFGYELSQTSQSCSVEIGHARR